MSDVSESPDVVLLTIDCWRHDAPDEMDSFEALTAEYRRRDAICPAPATRGVFPAILAGQYYPFVYDGSTKFATERGRSWNCSPSRGIRPAGSSRRTRF